MFNNYYKELDVYMYEEKLSSLEKTGIKLEENELEEIMINLFVDPKYKRIIQVDIELFLIMLIRIYSNGFLMCFIYIY